VNWEEVTAIGTAVLALSVLGALAAAIFAAQQVREARRTREAEMADEDPLVETRRLVARFKTSDELSAALQRYVDADAPEAYVLYRELDFFEQMAALERVGAFDVDLIKLLLGRTLIERWELWLPAVEAVHGAGVYPNFEALVNRLRAEL